MPLALVQRSFQSIHPILEGAAALFYERLFTLDPSLRALFRGSPDEQARKLAQALTVVVTSLDRAAQIRGAVEGLGRRHVGYGVRDEHYATVGEALIWTLEQGLGDAFTMEVRDARVAAYGWLALTMKRAAAKTEWNSPALRGDDSGDACQPRPIGFRNARMSSPRRM